MTGNIGKRLIRTGHSFPGAEPTNRAGRYARRMMHFGWKLKAIVTAQGRSRRSGHAPIASKSGFDRECDLLHICCMRAGLPTLDRSRPGVEPWRPQLAAMARALARAFPANRVDVEILKTIAMFCAVGLVVSLLLATNGLDMSAGFF